ncbi:WD40/YVTN/BNR-like repeat-containing protein [Pseudomonas vranovensis]|uniref:WD40/YVTN/BNR-like repeat-containing protein n=1 Tax=Pseudomonas vranovensis TaxID=321661 RepID=UPI003D95AE6E
MSNILVCHAVAKRLPRTPAAVRAHRPSLRWPKRLSPDGSTFPFLRVFRMKSLTLSVLALLFGMSSTTAAPLADRLERASRPSTMAVQMLLTDAQSLGSQLVMVGESGHILLRAADGVISQAQVPVDLLLTAVHFPDPNNGWAVGHDGVILHTSDAGKNWSKQLDGSDISKLMLTWAEAEVARLEKASLAAPDDDALNAKLDNALFALDDIKAGAESGPSRPLLDVWFRTAEEGWAVGAYGIFVHTRDGGKSWAYEPSMDNPERLHLNTLLGLASGSLLVAGEGGRLHRSDDGGAHWQPSQQLTQASLYNLLQLKSGQILAFGFGGTLLSSLDQGQSWHGLPLPVRASLYGGTQLADGSVLLAGQGGVLLYSRDGQEFKVWQGESKAPLLSVAALTSDQLARIGSNGLQVMPLATLKEQLQ